MRTDEESPRKRFVSLCSCGNDLYALADDGTVWNLVWGDPDLMEPEKWVEVGKPTVDRKLTGREARR